MRDYQRDLQAGHYLLAIYEQSKIQLDHVLDRQPALFAIVDVEGKVLRASDKLAAMGNLTDIFSPENWKIFRVQLGKVCSDEVPTAAFEAPVQGKGANPEPISVFWRLERLQVPNRPDLKLAIALGQDISDLRRAEKQLAEFFATTPVAILTIDPNGKISPNYSAYCEWLLATSELGGQDAFELIFSEGRRDYTLEELNALTDLPSALGKDISVFNRIKPNLPAEFSYFGGSKTSGESRWLGVTYHAVEVAGALQKILLILEDRSAARELLSLKESSKILQEESIIRILQVKNCKTELLRLLVTDFLDIFTRFKSALSAQDWPQVKNVLHGIKGTARIVNFQKLADLSHDFESFLSGTLPNTPQKLQEAEDRYQQVALEWQEYRDLISAFHKDILINENPAANAAPASELADILKRYRQQELSARPEARIEKARLQLALQTLNSTPLSDLETKLKALVDRLSLDRGLEVDLICNWNGFRADEELWQVLSNSLTHLLNNCIAHGIETAEVREQNKKPPKGTIGIDCSEANNFLHCVVWDDGRGIDVDRVRSVSLQKRIISLTESVSMPRHDLMQLIFSRGLSTATTIDQTAGRGVGLGAVLDAVKTQGGGSIEVVDRQPYGSQFKLSFPLQRKNPVKRFVTLSHLVERLNLEIDYVNKQRGLSLPKIVSRDPKSDSIFYGAEDELVLALSTILSDAATASDIQVTLGPEGDRLILDIKILKARQRTVLPPEFAITLPVCNSICFLHQGEMSRRDQALRISIGHILEAKQLPVITISPDSSLSAAEVDTTLTLLRQVGGQLGIRFADSGEKAEHIIALQRAPGTNEQPAFTAGGSADHLKNEIVRAVGVLLR